MTIFKAQKIVSGQIIKTHSEYLEALATIISTSKNQLEIESACAKMSASINWRNYAHEGQLDQLPKEILTQSNLLKTWALDRTMFHIAAQSKHLNQIPAEVLTQENLLKVDNRGNTVFHVAAWVKNLHQIPQDLLTEENLLATNTEGRTVFHEAAKSNCIDQIPGEVLVRLVNGPLDSIKHYNAIKSTFHIAASYGTLDAFLGIEMPDGLENQIFSSAHESLKDLGHKWFAKNQAYCEEMRKIKAPLEVDTETSELDIF